MTSEHLFIHYAHSWHDASELHRTVSERFPPVDVAVAASGNDLAALLQVHQGPLALYVPDPERAPRLEQPLALHTTQSGRREYTAIIAMLSPARDEEILQDQSVRGRSFDGVARAIWNDIGEQANIVVPHAQDFTSYRDVWAWSVPSNDMVARAVENYLVSWLHKIATPFGPRMARDAEAALWRAYLPLIEGEENRATLIDLAKSRGFDVRD